MRRNPFAEETFAEETFAEEPFEGITIGATEFVDGIHAFGCSRVYPFRVEPLHMNRFFV